MSNYVPSLPNRHHPAHWFFRFLYTFLYIVPFLIFGWPHFRISSTARFDGTRYSEYFGPSGDQFLTYTDNQRRPPLIILLPLFENSSEWKHGGVRYEIRQEQPR